MVVEDYLDRIVSAIKEKRELSGLDNEYVKEKIRKVLIQDKKIRTKIGSAKSFKELSRSKEFSELKKVVRTELRAIYGVFDLDEKRERKGLIKRLNKKNITREERGKIAQQLLLLHKSSKERIEQYEKIYKRIFTITGLPDSILDLGCGTNPYSYSYLGCRPTYIAMDLPSDDLKDIAEFFKTEGIDGEAIGIDLVKEYAKLGELLKERTVDIVLLFKLLDSLESVKRNISGKLLENLHARWIVVSFPLVSIGGRKVIRNERRAWFEKLLEKKELKYEKFIISNELFYVIKKIKKKKDKK